MHFSGLSRLSENRKQCPWKTSIFTCYLGPWGFQEQPSIWDNPGLLLLWKHEQPSPPCPSAVPGLQRHHSGEGFKGLPGSQREGWGAEGAGRRRGTAVLLQSSDQVTGWRRIFQILWPQGWGVKGRGSTFAQILCQSFLREGLGPSGPLLHAGPCTHMHTAK